ncbi:MAG TPA: STAS domain-containing protein [Actinospica sp.]|nr:STAS domain-containing protein [Actinospica sp.]
MSRLCTELDLSLGDGVAVVRLSGEITSANGPKIGELVLARLAGVEQLQVDLSQVSYLSSAGLRVLVLMHRRAEAIGAKVTVHGLRPQLRFVMQAIGFLDLFSEAVDEPVTEASA